jgi:hypothetical protein
MSCLLLRTSCRQCCSFRRRWCRPERRYVHLQNVQPRLFAISAAAWPSCFGEAPNAALILDRAPRVCILARRVSNSLLNVFSAIAPEAESASKSPTDIRTAFRVPCFVMNILAPRITVSRISPNSFFASVAVTDSASIGSPQRTRLSFEFGCYAPSNLLRAASGR